MHESYKLHNDYKTIVVETQDREAENHSFSRSEMIEDIRSCEDFIAAVDNDTFKTTGVMVSDVEERLLMITKMLGSEEKFNEITQLIYKHKKNRIARFRSLLFEQDGVTPLEWDYLIFFSTGHAVDVAEDLLEAARRVANA